MKKKLLSIIIIGTILFMFTPIVNARYFTDDMDVTPFLQDRSNYCGYAATKEVIHYLNGTSKSQLEYATEMGTPNSAAYYGSMKNLINSYTGKNYTTIDGYYLDEEELIAMVENAYTKNMLMILTTSTEFLHMCNGEPLVHYIVVTGYTISLDDEWNRRIFYVDSWSRDYGNGNTFGKHLDTSENIYNSVAMLNSYIIY